MVLFKAIPNCFGRIHNAIFAIVISCSFIACGGPEESSSSIGLSSSVTTSAAVSSSRPSSSPISSSATVSSVSNNSSAKSYADLDFTFCANEARTCAVSEPSVVRFGAEGKYIYVEVTDNILCDPKIIGDPLKWVAKQCFKATLLSSSSSSMPSVDFADLNYVRCSGEHERCRVSEPSVVRFGAQGRYVYQQVDADINCSIDVFGEPIKGTIKSCYIAPAPASLIVGLDQRPVSDVCVAGEAPASGSFKLTRIWPDLKLTQPIGLVQLPGGVTNPYFILQKTGLIRRISSDFSASTATDFLDLTEVVEAGGEGGVLSMAFHPQFPDQPYVYIAHMVDEEGFITRISRFTTDAEGLTASDEKILFNLPQTQNYFRRGSIHNAGTLAFGADGFLYMSIGDDKRTNKVGDPTVLYGTIIRIDVDTDSNTPYVIPASNPFNNEVYAYGFRNPWRISFDKENGDLWVGDVGEECFEEINKVQLGKNYGWPNWEADICGPLGCNGDNTLPEHKYHTLPGCGPGNSVTGGYVYRGEKMPNLKGKYIYGDYQTGLLWAYDPDKQFNEELIAEGVSSGIAAFGENNSGDLFHIDLANGKISLIESNVSNGVAGPPANLLDTGCFASLDPLVPAEGVIGYSIAHPFWSDGAEKMRFLSLPQDTRFNVDADGDWELPKGGVLIKHFKVKGENLETRFILRYSNGVYGAYTYEWTSASQAVLVQAKGKDITIDGDLPRHFPSRNECGQCHTPRAGYSLGPETRQLNITHSYPQTGRDGNQVQTLHALGMLAGNVTYPTPLPAPTETTGSLESRALAYLHANCAACHRGLGGGRSIWDARISTPFKDKDLCNIAPITRVTDFEDEHYVTPGNHQKSSIWWRIGHRGQGQMPPLGSTVVDQVGADLIAAWIDSLDATACD